MNYLRNPRRSSLSSENLEDLMRIRINGPKQVSKFRANEYARHFIDEENHLRADDPTFKKTKVHLDLEDIENNQIDSLPESNLF